MDYENKELHEFVREWTRQQQEMAERVVTVDDVPWQLDADNPERQLLRVGGLDISFSEREQEHDDTQPAGSSESAAAGFTDIGGSDKTAAGAAAWAAARAGAAQGDASGGGPAGAVATSGHADTSLGPGVAALVVLGFPELQVLYQDYEPVDLAIPYLPGYLGFRECAAYERLLARVGEAAPLLQPQVLLVDGCGVLHPRGCGSACQVGLTCGYPAVGVAKNLLAVDGLDRLRVRAQLQQQAAAAKASQPPPRQMAEEAEPPAVADAATGAAGTGAALTAPAGPCATVSPAAAATASSEPWTAGQSHGGSSGEQQGPDPTARQQPAAVGPTTGAAQAAAWTAAAAGVAAAELAEGPAAVTAEGQAAAGSAAAVAAAGCVARDVQVPLVGASGRVHGVALCPGVSKRPLYISVGHRLSLGTATELVRRCCVHRIPEPIRQADLRSRQWLRDHVAQTT